jgi:hypothetical protein
MKQEPKDVPREPYMRWSAEVTAGNIIQIVVFAIGLGSAYGVYVANEARQDGRIGQVEVLAQKDRDDTKEVLKEIKGTLAAQQSALNDVAVSLGMLRGRASAGGRP